MLPSYPFRYFPYEQRHHGDKNDSFMTTTAGSAFQNHTLKFIPSKPFCPPDPVLIVKGNYPTDNIYQSTTKGTYKPFKNQPPCCKYVNTPRSSTYNTNFKLPVNFKPDYFKTIHDTEYSHKNNDPFLTPAGKTLQVPQLDCSSQLVHRLTAMTARSDATNDITSEYGHCYLHHNISERKDGLLNAEKMNKDHVKRGIEAHNSSVFSTTTGDAFTNAMINSREKTTLSNVVLNEKAGVSSIPFGDQEKVKLYASQHQDSYTAPSHDQQRSSDTNSTYYNKEQALDSVYQSSIRLGDIHHFAGSPHTSQYPHHGRQERRLPVHYDRNKSSFPPGDLSPSRVKERMTHLSSHVYSKPPLGSFPIYADVSHLRTHSSVHFGQDTFSPQPKSTAVDSYKPMKVQVHHAQRPIDNMRHVFRYKTGNPLLSTAQESYDMKQLTTRTIHQSNLKESHWRLPYMGLSFETTHQTHYTAPPPPTSHRPAQLIVR